MAGLEQLRQRARQLKTETFALYLAARDPRTPWYARLVVAAVVAYAFSPVDLIPDFIPVLGYLDDLVLIPLGIALALQLVPQMVLAESRVRAREAMGGGRPVSWAAAALIVLIWLGIGVLCGIWAYRALRRF